MRILVIANSLSSNRGGQEHSLLQVCKGLASRNHEIVLLYDEPGDLLEEYKKGGISLRRVKGSSSSGHFAFNRSAPFKSSFAFMDFLRHGMNVRPEVIYINQTFDALFAGLLARLVGRRLICHLRLPPGVFCKQWVVGLRYVSSFIAISEQTRQEYVAAGFSKERISLVHNAIDSQYFRRTTTRQEFRDRYGISPDAFVVGYAGRIHSDKGIETLITGFAKSGLAEFGGKLLIAGNPPCNGSAPESGQYLEELQTLSEKLKIQEHVTWLGHVSDLPSFYSACDTIVLPTNGFSEPFGRVLIESMSCETPAIGSRIGGIPEVLRGEFIRFIFEPGNSKQLATLLLEVEALRKRDPHLGERCRQYVLDQFPLKVMIDKIESILAR